MVSVGTGKDILLAVQIAIFQNIIKTNNSLTMACYIGLSIRSKLVVES